MCAGEKHAVCYVVHAYIHTYIHMCSSRRHTPQCFRFSGLRRIPSSSTCARRHAVRIVQLIQYSRKVPVISSATLANRTCIFPMRKETQQSRSASIAAPCFVIMFRVPVIIFPSSRGPARQLIIFVAREEKQNRASLDYFV